MSASQQHRRSFLSAAHLAGQAILLNAISVPVMAYIIRSLGAERYGQWSTAAALVAVASVMTNLGLRGVFVRTVAQNPDSAEKTLAAQLGARAVLSLLAAAAVIAAVFALRYPRVIVECAAVASIGIFLTAASSALSDLLQGLNRISVYAAANFVGGLVLTALSVVVIWMGGGAVALAGAYLSGPTITALILLAVVQKKFFPVRISGGMSNAWRHLVHSRFFAAQQFTNTFAANQESLLLPKFVSSGNFGLFSGGLLLASRLTIVPDSLASAFYPVIANSHGRDPQASSRDVVRFLLLALLVCLPVVVVVLFLAGPIAHVLFPKNPQICQRVICITIWSLPLLGLENVMGYSLNAAGRDALQARYTVYSAAASLLLATILISQFGLIGACWSFVLRIAVKIAFIAAPFVRTFSPSLPLWRLARILAGGGAMAGGMWVIQQVLSGWNMNPTHPEGIRDWAGLLLSWGVQGTLGMAAYAVTLMLLRILHVRDVIQLLGRHPDEVLA